MLLVAATERELVLLDGVETFCCGIGPVEAGLRTARALAERRPDAVLHVGIAGAHGIEPPALVLGSEAVYCDVLDPSSTLPRVERAYPDPALLARVRAALPEARVLPIGTTGRVGGGAGCEVEAMEGFGVLRARELAGVPAVELRAISNSVTSATARWRLDAFAALEPPLAAAVGHDASQRARRVLDVVEELGVPAHGRRAVDEEEDLLVALVPRLERRARMDGEHVSGVEVDPLRRVLDEQREGAPEREEDLLLVRVEMAAATRPGRVAPEAGARLGQPRAVRDRGLAALLLPVQRLARLPPGLGCADDVVGHGTTIPCGLVARLSYPRHAGPRPEALPPSERTVGQVVAESIRLYGDRFWAVLPLGLAFVGVDLASLHRSVGVQTLVLWAFAPVFAAAYVRAASIVSGRPPTRAAFAAGLLLFLPFPVLVRLYVLPGVAWLALVGLAVPAAVVERLGVWAALRRGWQLGRADPVHAVGGLAALALVYAVSRTMLLVLLHTQGGQTQVIAAVLADLVLAPLVFLGGALLYADQAARVRIGGTDRGGA